MSNIFYKFQLSNKLLIILSGTLLIIFIAISLFYSHIDRVKTIDKITLKTLILKNHLIKLERNDVKFRETKDEIFAQAFEKDFIKVERVIKHLKKIYMREDMSFRYLNELQRNTKKYGFTFDEFSQNELILIKGKNSLDRLQRAKDRLHQNIEDMRVESLLKDILLLEIDERDFFTFREDYHIKKFYKNYDNFILRIKRSRGISRIGKNELLQNAENYQKIFSAIVEVVTKSRSIKLELKESIRTIYDIMDDFIKEAQNELKNKEKISEIIKLSIIAILSTAFIIFTIFLVFEIRRSIHRLQYNVDIVSSLDFTKEIVLVGDNEIDSILRKLQIFNSLVRNEIISVKETVNTIEREIERVTTLNIYLKDRADNFDVKAGEKRSMVSELHVVSNRTIILLDELTLLMNNSVKNFKQNSSIDKCNSKIDESSEINFEINKCLDDLNTALKNGENEHVSDLFSKTFQTTVKSSNSISAVRGSFLHVVETTSELLKRIEDITKRFRLFKENGQDFQTKIEVLLQTLTKIEDTLGEFSTREREGLKHIYVISDINHKLKERLKNIRV
jgi:methyl-accepting chemotaxis protein